MQGVKQWLLEVENQRVFQKMRYFSHLLSAVIMPNISIFIAWGLFSLLLGFTSGTLYENLNAISQIMLTYLLPLLVAYTGGVRMGGDKGGVVGALATLGILIGQGTPQLFSAILLGLFSGFIYKKIEQKLLARVHSGYTMLLKNYLSAICGVIFCFVGLFFLSPAISILTDWLVTLISLLIEQNLLPLASIFIEPLKILFFNNAINHGLLLPVGLQMSAQSGQSILFLLEANPGPGLGILLAYFFFDREKRKMDLSAAMMIQAIGGIHEIYFPFVLSNPALFLAVILGGMTGVSIFSIEQVGLTMPASPGSLLALISSVPRHSLLGMLSGVLASTLVSFMVAGILLRKVRKGMENVLEENETHGKNPVKEIIFACDAGMGSSAMAQGLFSRMLKEKACNLPVSYHSAHKLKEKQDALIVTYPKFAQNIARNNPKSQVATMENFLEIDDYERVYQQYLLGQVQEKASKTDEINTNKTHQISILYANNIRGTQTMAVERLSELLKNAQLSAQVQKAAIENLEINTQTIYIADKALTTPDNLQNLYVVENLLTSDYKELLENLR